MFASSSTDEAAFVASATKSVAKASHCSRVTSGAGALTETQSLPWTVTHDAWKDAPALVVLVA